MDYLEVTIQTASAGIELVANALTAGGFDSLVVEDQAEYENFLEDNRAYWDYIDEEFQQELQGLSRIKLYLEVDGTEEKQLLKLNKVLDALKKRTKKNLGSLEVSSQLLPETNWEESWKDNYPPQPIGEKLIVVPCWNPEANGRIPVILDPGLTFGTGAHPSTQMCMEFMEQRVRTGMDVIDLGSGSGILSIAALRLGAKTAVGVDIDNRDLKECADYFERYMQYHRMKHKLDQSSRTVRKHAVPAAVYTIADTKEHFKEGDTRTLSLFLGDTGLTGELLGEDLCCKCGRAYTEGEDGLVEK